MAIGDHTVQQHHVACFTSQIQNMMHAAICSFMVFFYPFIPQEFIEVCISFRFIPLTIENKPWLKIEYV